MFILHANCLQYSPEKHSDTASIHVGEKSEKNVRSSISGIYDSTRRDYHLPQICHPYFKFNIVSGPEESNKYL